MMHRPRLGTRPAGLIAPSLPRSPRSKERGDRLSLASIRPGRTAAPGPAESWSCGYSRSAVGTRRPVGRLAPRKRRIGSSFRNRRIWRTRDRLSWPPSLVRQTFARLCEARRCGAPAHRSPDCRLSPARHLDCRRWGSTRGSIATASKASGWSFGRGIVPPAMSLRMAAQTRSPRALGRRFSPRPRDRPSDDRGSAVGPRRRAWVSLGRDIDHSTRDRPKRGRRPPVVDRMTEISDASQATRDASDAIQRSAAVRGAWPFRGSRDGRRATSAARYVTRCRNPTGHRLWLPSRMRAFRRCYPSRSP